MKHLHTFIVFLCFSAFTHTNLSAGPVVGDWMHFNGLLASIAANDYDSFCTHGKEKLRNNVSREEFQTITTSLREILKSGYNATQVGYAEKDLNNIFVTWSINHKSDEPKIIIRVDFDGPGGNVTDLSVE